MSNHFTSCHVCCVMSCYVPSHYDVSSDLFTISLTPHQYILHKLKKKSMNEKTNPYMNQLNHYISSVIFHHVGLCFVTVVKFLLFLSFICCLCYVIFCGKIKHWRQMMDKQKPYGRLECCKEKWKKMPSVLGRLCSGFIMALSCVISCHLTLSQQSEAAGDEMRAEMRSNFNDPCGQIASLQQQKKNSILCLNPVSYRVQWIRISAGCKGTLLTLHSDTVG